MNPNNRVYKTRLRSRPTRNAAPAGPSRSPLHRYQIADSSRPCPLAKLPNELIIEIFQLVASAGGRSGPLPLTHICWFWRNIAHSTPRLWTDLTLEFAHGKYPDHVRMSIEWLGRAQGHARTMTISSRSGKDTCIPRSILKIIPYFADDMRALDFSLPFEAFLTMVPLPHSMFSSLEELRMAPLSFPRGMISRKRIEAFARAPKLRSLCLVLPAGDWDHTFLSILCIPFSQLSDLSITLQGPCTPRTTFRYISACTDLRRCTLNIPPFAAVFDASPPTEYDISELRSLTIRFVASARYSNTRSDAAEDTLIGQTAFMLNSLTMPQLEEFDLELSASVHRACTWDHGAMLSLVQRSGMPLRRLRLARIEVVSAQLVELLQAVPTLESLQLHVENVIESNFYQALGYRSRSTFLPDLTELVISEDGYSLDRGLDWFIEEAIAVRCQWAEPWSPGQTTLQRLHMSVTRELQPTLKLFLYSLFYNAHRTCKSADVYVADAKEWIGVDRKTNTVVYQSKKGTEGYSS